MEVVYFNTNFDEMTRKEARSYLREYVAGHPRRLEEFRQRVAAEGGPASELLDFSPESLLPLWSWLLPRVKADDFHGDFYLSYVEGLAAYFAECLLRNVPGVSWAAGEPGGKVHPSIDKNRPVLTWIRSGAKHKIEFNVNQVTMSIVAGACRDDPIDNRPERLREFYGMKTGEFADWKYIRTEQGVFFVEIPQKGLAEWEETDDETAIRAGKLELGLYRDDGEDRMFALEDYDEYRLYFDDDAYFALEEHYKWNEARLDALEAQLYAQLLKLEQRAGLLWEDKELFYVFLPKGFKDPAGLLKKAARAMVLRPIPEEELTWWKKKYEERLEEILRLSRQAKKGGYEER
jgi:hypothetical protein